MVFADHIGKFILGYWGAALFAFGILSASRKKEFMKGGVFYAFLLSALLYLIVIARGNVQHDYYQIFIVPTLAIFLGLGSSLMLNLPKDYFQRKALIVLFIISTAYTLGFGWYVIRDYFNINNRSIIAAGEAVDRLTPKEAKVIANYTGDTSFLYQTKRKGWASYEKDLPEMIKMGAEYLVLANPNQDDMKFAEKYKIVEQTPQYIIFDLRGR